MQGQFFWYDLMTTDTAAAAKFYSAVVGWTTQDAGGGTGYTLFQAKGRGVAGLMAIPEDARKMGVGPAWMGYIYVDDVDAMAQRVVAEGGTLHKPPTTVPGIIRFAVVADPQGAGFLIARPLPSEQMPLIGPNDPGNIGWRELFVPDWKSNFAFYEKLFGWTKAEAMDMGPMGTYQLFKTGGEWPAGGMMNKPEQVPMPFWGYYFNVEAIDAAAARVTDSGGTILMGPAEVPGPMWILQCRDPQGAYFALVAPTR